jgi:polyhydroxyalkanoate synthesis repressor PhaR
MPASQQPFAIKRYAGQRLYHGAAGAYVTVEDLAAMVEDGDDFVVHEAKTGKDVTRSVLKQIIIERTRHG